ncbi:MAG: hypothetical protein ACRDLF_15340 [Solirubrobacteraceae bacterium]
MGELARVHAEIWAQLQAAGRVIGAHDLWIPATAIAHYLRVATCSPGEFERVPGFAVLGWEAPRALSPACEAVGSIPA